MLLACFEYLTAQPRLCAASKPSTKTFGWSLYILNSTGVPGIGWPRIGFLREGGLVRFCSFNGVDLLPCRGNVRTFSGALSLDPEITGLAEAPADFREFLDAGACA